MGQQWLKLSIVDLGAINFDLPLRPRCDTPVRHSVGTCTEFSSVVRHLILRLAVLGRPPILCKAGAWARDFPVCPTGETQPIHQAARYSNSRHGIFCVRLPVTPSRPRQTWSVPLRSLDHSEGPWVA
jgi:hypothetical protein